MRLKGDILQTIKEAEEELARVEQQLKHRGTLKPQETVTLYTRKKYWREKIEELRSRESLGGAIFKKRSSFTK